MENETLNIKQVAEYLNCSVSTIRNLVRSKSIPIFHIGNRIYAKKSSLDLWISNQEFNNMQDTEYKTKIKLLKSEVIWNDYKKQKRSG